MSKKRKNKNKNFNEQIVTKNNNDINIENKDLNEITSIFNGNDSSFDKIKKISDIILKENSYEISFENREDIIDFLYKELSKEGYSETIKKFIINEKTLLDLEKDINKKITQQSVEKICLKVAEENVAEEKKKYLDIISLETEIIKEFKNKYILITLFENIMLHGFK